jgi:DNA-directed RNA polymerase specialized sigma24 family protein
VLLSANCLKLWSSEDSGYKVACNHLLTKRKQKSSHPELTFDSFGEIITAVTIAAPPLEASDPERSVLLEEVRLNCMQGSLTCLEIDVRIAVILVEFAGVTSKEGAVILGAPQKPAFISH